MYRPTEPRSLHPAHGFLGVVACGGAGSRMGRDKALLELDGEALYARAARALAPLVREVVLAPGPRPLGDPRWREVPDAAAVSPDAGERRGPLGALVGGLGLAAHEGFAGVLFVACDLAGLVPAALAPLAAAVAEGRADVAHWTRDGHDEPLCAAVGVGSLAALRAAFLAGERRPAAAFGALRRWTPPVPDTLAPALVNVNTPADLGAFGADRWLHRTGPAPSNSERMRGGVA